MAKRSHKVSYKGKLDARKETVTETVKISKEESIDVVYHLGEQIRSLFREFDGCVTSITISMETEAVEDTEPTPKEETVDAHRY